MKTPFNQQPMRRALALATAAALSLGAMSGCAKSSDEEVGLAVVYQDQYCHQPEGVTQLSGPEALIELRKDAPSSGAQEMPTSAFTHGKHLFLISLGQKNSGGYAIGLDQTSAKVKGKTLELPVGIEEPAPGAMQSMQITSPCLVVAAEPGSYTEVTVASRPGWRTAVQPTK